MSSIRQNNDIIKVVVKTLFGDSVYLNIDYNDEIYIEDDNDKEIYILRDLYKINRIQYPLGRTHLLKYDENEGNDEIRKYFAYIEPYLCLDLYYTIGKKGFMNSPYKFTFTENEDFDERFDGKICNEYRGTLSLKINFEMPTSTFYRLYCVSILNDGPIISYTYDSNGEDLEQICEQICELKQDKEEYIKNVIINRLNLKNEEEYTASLLIVDDRDVIEPIDVIIILHSNGNMVYSL
jgi:hypothetical protein